MAMVSLEVPLVIEWAGFWGSANVQVVTCWLLADRFTPRLSVLVRGPRSCVDYIFIVFVYIFTVSDWSRDCLNVNTTEVRTDSDTPGPKNPSTPVVNYKFRIRTNSIGEG